MIIDEKIEQYILDIVRATRDPGEAGLAKLSPLIRYGASPRAAIHFLWASRAHAYLAGRAFVLPEDVRAVCPDVLRHRIVLSYEAEADGVAPDAVVTQIMGAVQIP
jgi:MoxR-like ATPase